MRFFRSPNDLAGWVKKCGSAEKAAKILVNLPKVGETNVADVVETTKRIVEANDGNAAEVLYNILKTAGIADDDVKKVEAGVDVVEAADEMLRRKLVTADAHSQMVKKAQIMRQPGQYDMPLRICPKLPWSVGKKLISTYNCRHYCLDGIVLDDDPARVYCGELLWRRHIADKFSSDQQDRKTGELYGGYINERFYKFPDAGTPANQDVPRDGGNPMMLKPGERTRQPRPHQWSIERRMQEAREKGSTKGVVLNKAASAGWLGRMIKAQTDGGYVDFSFNGNGDLVMTPTESGIQKAKEYVDRGDRSDTAFLAMIEDHLANGWRIVEPEEIGALTSALIITNDANDDVWTNIRFYQIRSELEDFAFGNPVVWEKVSSKISNANSQVDRMVEAQVSVNDVSLQTMASGTITKVINGVEIELEWTMTGSKYVRIPDIEFEWPKTMMMGVEDTPGEWNGDVKNPNTGEMLIGGAERERLEEEWASEIRDAIANNDRTASSTDKIVIAKKKGKPVNPWAVCHTTVDKDQNPDKYEQCVMDVKKEHPIKKSNSEIAKAVIMAANKDSFVKLSSAVIKATDTDGDIVNAFSMAVDLANEGVDAKEAVLKIAEANGITIGDATRIRAAAIKKFAAHVSDVYEIEDDTPEKEDMQQQEEVQKDATELGLVEEQ
jgi:hypothetical protein